MHDVEETIETVQKRLPGMLPSMPIPPIIRENIAFWYLYDKLAPRGEFPSVYAQRKGIKALGGLVNFVKHRKLGKLAHTWLLGEWNENESTKSIQQQGSPTS